MDLAEIRARMKAKGLHQGHLANVLGMDPTAVSKRLTGNRPIRHHEMIKITALLADAFEGTEQGGAGVQMVPVIGQVAAGTWKEAIQSPGGYVPIPMAGAPRSPIALRVAGDSMDLEIEDGGIVIVDTDDTSLFAGRLYVLLNADGEATFKQYETEPARLVPRSSNSAHKTIRIGDGQPFSVLGRVTALHRSR